MVLASSFLCDKPQAAPAAPVSQFRESGAGCLCHALLCDGDTAGRDYRRGLPVG